MTRDVKTVRPSTPLGEAVNVLIGNRFGCLPVVDEDNKLVGIVTEHDLLKDLAGLLRLEEGEGTSSRRYVRVEPNSRP